MSGETLAAMSSTYQTQSNGQKKIVNKCVRFWQIT